MKTFTVKPEHILLLQSANVSMSAAPFEMGSPRIDPKRPYGNGDVYGDIAGILDIPTDGDGFYSDEDIAYMANLHKETGIALQIFLSTLGFELGTYTAPNYSREWTLSDE